MDFKWAEYGHDASVQLPPHVLTEFVHKRSASIDKAIENMQVGCNAAQNACDADQVVAFVFPAFSGHINPSFPMARRLVERGATVHYLTYPQFSTAVESAGATFHDVREWQDEMWTLSDKARETADPQFIFRKFMEDSGVVNIPEIVELGTLFAWGFMRYIGALKAAPGTRRFLQQIKANAVVYCPIVNLDAVISARSLSIPSISLLTTAGPGSFADLCGGIKGMEIAAKFAPKIKAHVEAVAELNQAYGLDPPLEVVDVFPFQDNLRSSVNLVTTTEALADTCPDWLRLAMHEARVSFQYVGPLLDIEGAKRVGGHKAAVGTCEGIASNCGRSDMDQEEMMNRVHEARRKGKRILYASLGTVLTSDSEMLGWDAAPIVSGTQLISSKELCRAAWQAVFSKFGSDDPELAEWLIIVSLGPQPKALAGIHVPKNATCLDYVHQVDLLRAGVDVFLTHGGQNSMMESIAHSTPIVVCPGFGDQPINGAKAERLRIGIKVDRAPKGSAAQYQADVELALERVAGGACFKVEVQKLARSLMSAGGTDAAVQTVAACIGLM